MNNTTKQIMANQRRYLQIVDWAKRRYTENGRLVISVGDVPSTFKLIEQAAWNRYMEQGK